MRADASEVTWSIGFAAPSRLVDDGLPSTVTIAASKKNASPLAGARPQFRGLQRTEAGP
jgi:hypothetical protein